MNRSYRLLYIILVGLSIVACSRKGAPLVSSMQTEGLHHKWKVKSADGMPAGGDVYIDLRDIRHSGATAGCRYFSFTPKFGHNNRMQIANISTHLLSCTDNLADQTLKLSLESVYSFSVTDKLLRLLAKDGHIVFSAERASDDEGNSISRKWLIQEMINANNEQLTKGKSFLDLTDLARAQAGVGCNRFSFKVTADHTYHMALGDAATTEMYCKDAAANESVFSKLLPLVNKYQVVGNSLKLFDKDNVLLLLATEIL
ncbi:META domain-containing protein [Niabella yanshanensis]|uniref:META domain-containing protein n=1 Tax=Niabella yanshanensis TaxID=577386 RepID=A0ABZ0WAI7_9BACT|nr:META domain-containing protein [Niabella yanshanensis]WQD40297.1 META domain-containing protein [Niabella yanshanensis]